jgi:serine/threonine protein phosphatase 1
LIAPTPFSSICRFSVGALLEIHMNQIVQRYRPNPRGRDFVVSDIHGCFDKLREALADVDFIAESDRLFSVGDLIDRGPRSTETLDWLARPWFHPCIGNHEDMALKSQHDNNVLVSWVSMNGGQWWLALDAGTREKYLAAFRQLPVVMEIETRYGRVGIVHADIPEQLSWQAFLDALEAGDAAAREIAVWSRRRADGLVTGPVEGIDQVVCGHTIMSDRRVYRSANVWFIDTGAFLPVTEGGHLSLLTLDSLFDHSKSTGAGTDYLFRN